MTKKEYYPNSRESFSRIIKTNFPGAKPQEVDLETDPRIITPQVMSSHLLWMLEKIGKMEKDDGKAGRWLGYVIGWCEALRLLDNKQSRDIVRQDMQDNPPNEAARFRENYG